MSAVEIVEVDLEQTEHHQAIVDMLNAYAMDIMGAGKPLSPETQANLIPGLRQHPTTIIFLAYEGLQPVGIAVCFRGFSTFAAKPLINISDFFVFSQLRGQGIGRMLLEAVARKALTTGCCKLTLEVQENNHRAQRIYRAAGFSQAVHVAEAGGVLFMTKPL